MKKATLLWVDLEMTGLEPEKDIQIVEIGLRPGEKLYEELLMQTEHLDQTENRLIYIERDTPYSREEIEEKLQLLAAAIAEDSSVQSAMKRVVPTYRDANEVNEQAEQAKEMQQIIV